MTGSWYYMADGIPNGPVPLSELQDRFRAGQLRPLDLVGCDGMPHWQFAALVGGLVPTPWSPVGDYGALPSSGALPSTGSLLPTLSRVGRHATGHRRGAVADPDGLQHRLRQLWEQGLLSQDDYEVLVALLDRSPGVGPVARGRQLSRLGRRFRRPGHDTATVVDANDDEIFDAAVCEVADGEEVADAVDYGPEAYDDDDYEDDDASGDDDDYGGGGDFDGDDADDLGETDDLDDLAGVDDDLGADVSDGVDDDYGAGGDFDGGGDYGGGGDD